MNPIAISSLNSAAKDFEVTYLADWLSSLDGEFHYCHRWIPCKAARTVERVCIAIHGLGDHGGRFDEFGRNLAAQGIAVQAIDLTGHGRSPGKRGRIKSFDQLLDEIAWSIREAGQVWRNADITLMGHSMGGNLVLNYLAKRMAEVQSDAPKQILSMHRAPQNVIAVAPMLRPYGRQIRDDFFKVGCRLAEWIPNWPMRMKHRTDLLTRDVNQSKRYLTDPLIHRTMSIRLGIELLLAGRELIAMNEQSEVPCLLVHGSNDRLSDINASREYAASRGNCELWEVTGELHDPLNGVSRESIYATMLQWLGVRPSPGVYALNAA